jgi:clan AA aspartic protease (TIGR02281 family)
LATFAPYVVALIIADRVLTVRKGYAALSIIAIVFLAIGGLELSNLVAGDMLASLFADNGWLTMEQQAGLAAGGIALLLHAWPLWIGLRDDGDIAARLVARGEEARFDPARAQYLARRSQDIYYRQTADLRGWHSRNELEGLRAAPRENFAVKTLTALTWIGVAIAVGTAYYNWGGIIARNMPAQVASPAHLQTSIAQAAAPNLPLAPLAPPRVQRDIPAPVAIPSLPTVQRPSDVSANIQGPSSGYAGANEAVAERGGDGSFAFDAIVNGAHVPMLFDTGASVVAIRGEDAPRLGIAMGKLTYSARVKTANGVAEVAPVIIDTLTIGNITQRAVRGFVAKQGALQANLLGQSFLVRLAGYNVEKNLLLLKGH